MIIYFTGTGNSEYIAKNLADASDDTAVSITEVDPEITLSEGEMLGFVTPVYFAGLPSIVKSFLDNLEISGDPGTYIYGVVTYGTTPGSCSAQFREAIEMKGWNVSATFGVQMTDNWTPIFDCSDKEKIAKKRRKEQSQINSIAFHLQHESEGDFVRRKLPKFIAGLMSGMYEKARKTSHFQLSEDLCNGCGLCARECPLKVIQMHDKKPDWVRGKCTMCLRCLHHCPMFAIQYDNKTQNHGQYVHS